VSKGEEIKRVTLKVGKQTLGMSIKELRHLYSMLVELFASDAMKPVIPEEASTEEYFDWDWHWGVDEVSHTGVNFIARYSDQSMNVDYTEVK